MWLSLGESSVLVRVMVIILILDGYPKSPDSWQNSLGANIQISIHKRHILLLDSDIASKSEESFSFKCHSPHLFSFMVAALFVMKSLKETGSFSFGNIGNEGDGAFKCLVSLSFGFFSSFLKFPAL